ncbi:hypothetical protein TrVE_jg9820 [Triparma verrucosa]|uniref:Ketosynthase family 3 (KS3) domain-containing protein n=1 Tax=Triparma verrucosa TaxID=1606542 RepID=A0A9W7C9B7_9STRA|nr:hypothetical protein TrVE_jg9820 [Triparma verrucosa]
MDAVQSALLGAAAAAALTALTGNTNAQRARKAAIAETLQQPKAQEKAKVDEGPPENVGILALEPYFPSTYLEQSELEAHNGVSAGKYTIGLGQAQMSLCTDNEDPTSMGLTVLTSLLKKYDIKGSEIGRLEIGTETLTDKSKSLKTSLLRALGNPNVEGATNLNACYGGTAAFLNCVNYCANPCNKGKKAICVIVDIAAYARGAARPTSGSGAVAVLVGEDSWLKFGGVKASWTEDVWDFYKADHEVEYPQVDGKVSQECYFRSLRGCYEGFRKEYEARTSKLFAYSSPAYWVFHAPYNKLVRKSFSRLQYYDDPAAPWCAGLDIEGRDYDKLAQKRVEKDFNKKMGKGLEVSRRIGNTYAASVFMGLCGVVEGEDLKADKELAVFSYGSGSIATMYNLVVRETDGDRFTLVKCRERMKLKERLGTRVKVGAEELDLALDCREIMHSNPKGYSPLYPTASLWEGTYFLQGIDDKFRRSYSVKKGPVEVHGGALATAMVKRLVKEKNEGKVAREETKVEEGFIPITGVAVGLPGFEDPFSADNIDKLLSGQNMIHPISGSLLASMLEKNVYQLKTTPSGREKIKITSEEMTLKLAAKINDFDATKFGVPKSLVGTMDLAASVGVACGLNAMKNAGLLKGGNGGWELEEGMRDDTGVIYITSFPGLDATVDEVMRFLQSKTVGAAGSERLVEALRSKFLRASAQGKLSDEDEASFARLRARAREEIEDEVRDGSVYEFDRKFLFKVLCLGNSQLAQVAKCRGPNCQVNTACSGTTTGLSIASDWIRLGRCKRVVVIAGDSASSDALLPFIGNGFVALGAATTKASVDEGARPFNPSRSGMIVGSGGVGIVLESASVATPRSAPILAHLIHSQFSNSAYHGAAMSSPHIASELTRFLADVEKLHGITKEEIAQHGVYYAHETSTNSSPTASCSYNEITALRSVFGSDLLSRMLITNTKGFTGHSMGVSFEDAACCSGLKQQKVPPVANLNEIDKHLGDIKLSEGGDYAHRYSLRLGAGFGSQVAWALYGR